MITTPIPNARKVWLRESFPAQVTDEFIRSFATGHEPEIVVQKNGDKSASWFLPAGHPMAAHYHFPEIVKRDGQILINCTCNVQIGPFVDEQSAKAAHIQHRRDTVPETLKYLEDFHRKLDEHLNSQKPT